MTLAVLLREPREVEIAGERVLISPLRIRDIPTFSRAVAPAVAGRDRLTKEEGDSLTAALASRTDRDVAWVRRLPAVALAQLLSEALDSDEQAKPKAHGTKKAATDDGWAVAFQRLVTAGHSRDAILDYTLPEVRLYLDAIDELDRSRLVTDLHLNAVAAQGDKKAIERTAASLRKQQ